MNKIICLVNYKKATSLYDQVMGLMFKDSIDKPLLFEFKTEDYVPVHMLFVRFPINVYYLDKEFKVVEVVLAFKPWQIHWPRNKCKYIVETPCDYIADVGDKFDFGDTSDI